MTLNKMRVSQLDNMNNNGNLFRKNPVFNFAIKHALLHYSSNAIYTFIPKNACSSFRLSLGLANGLIRNEKEHDWIHNNNDVFQAALKDVVRTPYSFVILRCPYERLLSVYLDKIVGRSPLAWSVENKLDRKVQVSNLTFLEFVKVVNKLPTMDHHWRPQSDFLIYEEYDDYFDLKNLSYAKQKLKDRIDFELIDARNLYKHGNDQIKERYDNVEEAFNINPIELLYQKHQGRLPNNKHFFNNEIVEIIRKVYKKDIALYSEHFGAEHLLF